MTKSIPDHYAVLGLSSEADSKMIQARYRVLVKRYHPDMADGDKVLATQRFRSINEAYEVLQDVDRRLEYDRARKQKFTSVAKQSERTVVFREASNLDEESQQAWTQSANIYPHVEKIRKELLEIAAPLAATFQVTLLASGEFGHALEIARNLKATYMARYLDKAPHLLNFPEWLRNIPRPDLEDEDG